MLTELGLKDEDFDFKQMYGAMQRDRHLGIAQLSEKEREKRALALKVLLGVESEDILVRYDPDGESDSE